MKILAALSLAVLLGQSLLATAAPAAPGATTVTPLIATSLAGAEARELSMLEVRYAPGAVDPIHRHDAQVIVYVLEGEIIMQVKGGPETRLGVGQTFYESPTDIHVVGRNASATEPARFLAIFVKDKGTPVLTPVP